MDTPFEGTKLLEVASIDPGSAGDKPDANAPKDAKDDGVPRTGIAMVIDTTISMKPYIDQSLNVVRAIFDSVAKDKLDDKVSFGIVAFRNSTKASPRSSAISATPPNATNWKRPSAGLRKPRHPATPSTRIPSPGSRPRSIS